MITFKPDKNQISYKIKELLVMAVEKVTGEKFSAEEIQLEHPENPSYGDYSSNLALAKFEEISKFQITISKQFPSSKFQSKNPRELAQLIVKNLAKADFLEKVEVAGPGFINFYLSKKYLIEEMAKILKEKESYGRGETLKDKSILLEHTSPNPIKTMHLGHLRNNFLGMSVYQILKFLGALVTLDCIDNDRGTQVCQAMWGYLAFGNRKSQISNVKTEDLKNFNIPEKKIKNLVKDFEWKKALEKWSKKPEDWLEPKDLELKPDHFDLRIYSAAAKAIKLLPELKKQVAEMLVAWEKEEKTVWQLWRKITNWSLEGYEKTYKRISSHHDHVWHESELYKEGKEMVYEGLKKGIFKKSQGAVVTDLAKYHLPDTVVIRSDGTSLYLTFDLNLTLQKKKKFSSDLYIWDIGNDQKLYLQQMFSVCEQLGINKREKMLHLNYGYVFLKGKGKMSSREGTIISADDLIDLLVKKAQEIREKSQKSKAKGGEGDELIGLSALKYGMLKNNRSTNIYFDIDESVSLKGNSGPYLQYTFARCHSILSKVKSLKACPEFVEGLKVKSLEIKQEEEKILRTIYQFPEIVLGAGERFDPSILAGFLYDLCTKFNTFYNKYRILNPEDGKEETKEFRLGLTSAVGQILETGLRLLGIQPVNKM